MYIRILAAFLTLIMSTYPAWSFTCYYTLAKDNCWTDYNVSVDVVDVATSKVLFTLNVPAGTSWGRQEFSCHPLQNLVYIAKFSPLFWQNDAGKTYPALRSWTLPAKTNPGDLAWTIPVCYASDFSQVPLPPDAKGNCACDFSNIPQPKPQ